MAFLKVIRPGLFTTVQDCGRWGFQSRGVPLAGAMDLYSHRLANRLVGNARDAATLEVTLMGPHVEFEEPAIVAVTGAAFLVTLDERPVRMNEAIEAPAGSVLKLGDRTQGARAYIAIGGGILVPLVLNSRSTHVLSGMGGLEGRALRAGDRVPVAEAGSSALFAGAVGKRPRPLSLPEGGARLRVLPGPRAFEDMALARFQISPRSDRMGYRLDGAAVGDVPPAEQLSRAMPMGAVQIPPAGHPILLMADHATTGGYAVAATVISADLPLAAQLGPGDWIEFEACSLDDADDAFREQEAAFVSA